MLELIMSEAIMSEDVIELGACGWAWLGGADGAVGLKGELTQPGRPPVGTAGLPIERNMLLSSPAIFPSAPIEMPDATGFLL